ncbi:MAG: metallophosphoesterase family protein [Candidatus Thorarchaeota archaeon]
MKNRILPFIIALLFVFAIFPTITLIGNTVAKTENESFEPWHFIALGDSRNSEENTTNIVRQKVIESVVNNNPNLEFILHSGDMVLHGGEQDEWDRYYEDIDIAVQNDIQFYYAVGNHEIYTHSLPDGSYGPSETNFSTYMKNVEMPGNERYYSFDFNQIHFIVINSEEYWHSTKLDLTIEQKNWIISDLESNSEKFVVAMVHRPCYSVRSGDRVADALAIRTVLEPILIEYGVDLVFSGHDHYYYRTTREGITHVVTGGAGAPLYSPSSTSHAIEGDVYFAKYHYVNITVTDENVKLECVTFYNDIVTTTITDTFEIKIKKASYEFIIPSLIGLIVIVYWRKRN